MSKTNFRVPYLLKDFLDSKSSYNVIKVKVCFRKYFNVHYILLDIFVPN